MLKLGNQTLLADELADLLDKVNQSAENGPTVQATLGTLIAEANRLDAKSLIQRAQGVVGMINASPPGSAIRDQAYEQLTKYKLKLRNLAASDEL